MSQETYTFACPVCTVRLSVPKALAGVRGPCPQCHHDITAPEPEEAAMALVGSQTSAALLGTQAPISDRLPPPAAPRLPTNAPRLPVPAVAEETQVPQASAAPPDAVVEQLEMLDCANASDADEESLRTAPMRPAPAPSRRRSRFGTAIAVVIVLGLLALAAHHFLPRQSLRSLMGRVLPSQVVDAVIDPEMVSDGNAMPWISASTAPAADPPPETPGTGTTEVPRLLGIRPIESQDATPLVEASEDPAIELAATTDEEAPAPGSIDFANTPAATDPLPPESADPASAAPDAMAPHLVTPPETGAASLLPDVSEGTAQLPEVVDDARAGAQEALTLFLRARTWRDRMVLSDGGESLREEMEAYYRKVKDGPHPPTSVEHITSGPLPDGAGTVEVFHVTFADLPQGFPVPVRQTKDGWRIDWQAFVEFREGKLQKFFAQYQDTPALFRVRFQRARYQDSAVPNLDRKYVFRVSSPIDGHHGYVFVDKEDSIVGSKIADKLEWNAGPFLIMVKLKWVRGANGRRYVELRDIVSESWRPTP